VTAIEAWLLDSTPGGEIFQQPIKGLRKVNYVRERVLWNTSWAPGGSKERAYSEQLIFSKNDEWKYECELRQLFTLSGLPQRTLENGSKGYFLPIPPNVIVSVSLGMPCQRELEERVRLILKDARFSHVKLDRARLHDHDFALEFDAI
jgi:hypothetical protein